MAHSPVAIRPMRLVEADDGEPRLLDLDDAFRRFAPLIASVSLRMLGRPQEVEDLVQDVFLEARRSLAQIRSPGAFKYWLIKVTVREAKRRLHRRRFRTLLGLESNSDYEGIIDQSASTSHRTFVGELYRLLDQIPVNHRIAWTLRYIEGESSEEVAEKCNCSLATAKRWISAAHRIVVKAFTDE
jgi:RNA polymerase sigma-70 factor (ECF subfamily)